MTDLDPRADPDHVLVARLARPTRLADPDDLVVVAAGAAPRPPAGVCAATRAGALLGAVVAVLHPPT